MVDEYQRKSMSYALELSLQEAVMSDVRGVDKRKNEKMPYMDMANWLYTVLTLSYFVLTIACAILIPNVTVVFGFVSAFSVSAICYTLPGSFYLLAMKKYPKPTRSKLRDFMAMLYICLGLFLFLFLLTNEIITIAQGQLT